MSVRDDFNVFKTRQKYPASFDAGGLVYWREAVVNKRSVRAIKHTLAKTQERDCFQHPLPSEAQQQLAHQFPWQQHLWANGQEAANYSLRTHSRTMFICLYAWLPNWQNNILRHHDTWSTAVRVWTESFQIDTPCNPSVENFFSSAASQLQTSVTIPNPNPGSLHTYVTLSMVSQTLEWHTGHSEQLKSTLKSEYDIIMKHNYYIQ